MSYIESVREFHESFEHPINSHKSDIDLKLRQLRVKLLFEELEELATASDVLSTFNILCSESIEKNKDISDGFIVNKKEEIDALCDIQYVLSGAVLVLGYQDIFDEAFNEVHRSNMSKMCGNMNEVLETQAVYSEKGVDSIFIEKGNGFIVLRKEDNKVLKNVNYSEADLERFI